MVNELRLLVKMQLMEIILEPKRAMNKVRTKKICFGYCGRFAKFALTYG